MRSCFTYCGTQGIAGEKVDKGTILKRLNASHFSDYWDKICNLYEKTLNYLIRENYVISQDWIPSENMLIPLMMFCNHRGIRSDGRTPKEIY